MAAIANVRCGVVLGETPGPKNTRKAGLTMAGKAPANLWGDTDTMKAWMNRSALGPILTW